MGAVKVDDAQLLGALAAFKQLDKQTRTSTAKATRTTLRPLWQNIIATRLRVAQRSISPRQDAIIGKGAVAFTAAGKGSLKAYSSRKKLSGGLSSDTWQWVEFGTKDLRRPGGPRYAGTRLPLYTPGGRMAYKGISSWAPTAARVYLAVLADVLRSLPGAEDI